MEREVMGNLFGPIDSGNENESAPRKVIHDPGQYEIEAVNAALNRLGIIGAQKGILLMGEKVFEQDWVTPTTRNWLALLKNDVNLLLDCTDSLERKLRSVMVDLDYMSVMLSLEHDAVSARMVDEATGGGDERNDGIQCR